MTQEDLLKVKQVQLQIMDEIHRLCEKHSIKYYLIAGSLLGAVRHKGFIPWDVDIDIGMPREEYERFKKLCQQELDSLYAYCDYRQKKIFFRPHALVYHKKSKLKIKYDCYNPVSEDCGIYIDIFPLDNAPDDEKLRKKHAKQLKRICKFKQCRIPYSYSSKKWKRWAHYILSALLSWIPLEKLNGYQQKVMCKYRHQQTQCICSMASRYAYKKQCMPKEIYGEPVKLEFEGRFYNAPSQYTTYLTRLYGDYMQLPPEEKRQANLEIYRSVDFWE